MTAEQKTQIALMAAYQAEQNAKEAAFIREFAKRSGVVADKHGMFRRIAVIPRGQYIQGRQVNKPQEGDPEYLNWVLKTHPEFMLPK